MPDFVLGADMTKDEILQIAGEPVAKVEDFTGDRSRIFSPKRLPVGANLYTEAQLLAAYAKGAEDMRDRAVKACEGDAFVGQFMGLNEAVFRIRALPIMPTEEEQ